MFAVFWIQEPEKMPKKANTKPKVARLKKYLTKSTNSDVQCLICNVASNALLIFAVGVLNTWLTLY